jgi:hypothetical protein
LNSTILYGQRGTPVGSVEGDCLFDRNGKQIGYLSCGHVYLITTGERIGCYSGDIVYNVHGAPQAFAEVCQKSLLPVVPRLSPIPPRLTSIGQDVSQLPPRPIPKFLRHDAFTNGRDHIRDGEFL